MSCKKNIRYIRYDVNTKIVKTKEIVSTYIVRVTKQNEKTYIN